MNPLRVPVFAAWLMLPLLLWAQPYRHAGGVRAGYSSGLTYKGFFLHSMTAVQFDALYNQHGLNISATYLIHRETSRNSRWLLYFGGGIFGGEWEQQLSLGLVAIGGIEYVLRDLPLNFGLDWKPMLNLYREFHYDLLDFGITIRYRFEL